MGYTPTDLERTAIDRLVHPDDRAAVRETLAFVTDAPVGTTDRVTPRLGHADGTWQVSELTLTNRLADPTVEGSSSPEPVRARRPIRQSMTGFVRASTGSRTRFHPWPAGRTPVCERRRDVAVHRHRYRYRRGTGTETSTAERSSDRADPIGTVVWDLLPDELGEALYDGVRAAETTGSAETLETALPPLEGRLAVTVHPGDDGVSVHAREQPPMPRPR